MKLKINDNYVNEIITTQRGFCFKKGESGEGSLDDFEIKQLVKQGILIIAKEEFKEKVIIKDEISQENVIKEVVSEENTKKINEIKQDFTGVNINNSEV